MPYAPRIHRPHGSTPSGRMTYRQELSQPSRQTPWRRWYSLAIWKRIRDAVLIRDGLECQECKRNGVFKLVKQHTTRQDADNQGHADHIKSHGGNWEKFIDMENLETKCGMCHRAKTARTDGAMGNPKE